MYENIFNKVSILIFDERRMTREQGQPREKTRGHRKKRISKEILEFTSKETTD
jgi:hypothetical protein